MMWFHCGTSISKLPASQEPLQSVHRRAIVQSNDCYISNSGFLKSLAFYCQIELIFGNKS